MPRKKTHDEYIVELRINHPNIEVLEEYKTHNTKLLHKCLCCERTWLSTPACVLHNKDKCPKCSHAEGGLKQRRTHEDFVRILNGINPSIKVLGEYVISGKKIEFLCLKCKGVWDALPNDLIQGSGCPYCCDANCKVLVGFNDLHSTRPDISRWLLNPEDGYKYSKGSNVKVDWVCPDCGTVVRKKTINQIAYTNKISCRVCSDGISYPEKIMFSLLNQLGIEFETEKIFSWGSVNLDDRFIKIRYDFYFKINNREYVVETDGAWHKKDNNLNGTTKEKSKFIDTAKDRLAEEHNISVIRVDCGESSLEYIKDKITSGKLPLILNLDTVDWNKCAIDAIHSHKIKAVDLWNQGLLIGEIAKIVKRSKPTIASWLKTCTRAGLCNYDATGCLDRLHRKKPSSIIKRVVCVETNEIFPSMTQAAREKNLQAGQICSCCSGKRKTAGGLHWEYAS